MKQIILSLTALVLTTALFAQRKADEVAKFATEIIDQGKLKQNNPEEVKFTVTNITKEPLIIELASPTCGCTIGDYTKTPIAPGSTGYVSAKFNAANVGHFTKSISVKFAGVDEVKSVTITGDVLTAEDYDKWKTESAAPAIVKTPATIATPVKSLKLKPATTTKVTPAKSAKTKKPVTTTKS